MLWKVWVTISAYPDIWYSNELKHASNKMPPATEKLQI